MLAFVESLCKQYCSEETYRSWGQTYWPEKLFVPEPDPTWQTWLDELSPTVKILAVTSVAAVAVAGVYWMRHRQVPEVVVVPPATRARANSSLAAPAEPASAQLQRRPASAGAPKPEPKNPQPVAVVLKKAPPELHAQVKKQEKEVRKNNAIGGKVTYQAGERFPAWLIVQTYMNKHNKTGLKTRVQAGRKDEVIQDVLSDLKLPLDGVYPTEPEGVTHFNEVVTKLGLQEHCIRMRDGIRI